MTSSASAAMMTTMTTDESASSHALHVAGPSFESGVIPSSHSAQDVPVRPEAHVSPGAPPIHLRELPKH